MEEYRAAQRQHWMGKNRNPSTHNWISICGFAAG